MDSQINTVTNSNTTSLAKNEDATGMLAYDKLFWLFMAGNLLGVIIEGIWSAIDKGHWESHVITVWGKFNLLYGAGAVILYICSVKMKKWNFALKFIGFTVVATLLEFVCGCWCKYCLGMIAWDYSPEFLNVDGIICLKFSLVWGIAGSLFSLIVNRVNGLLSFSKHKLAHMACVVLSLFMAVNIVVSFSAICRWSSRHFGYGAANAYERLLDEKTPDEWMQKRFMEWRFV